jgi:hypothetical protein
MYTFLTLLVHSYPTGEFGMALKHLNQAQAGDLVLYKWLF